MNAPSAAVAIWREKQNTYNSAYANLALFKIAFLAAIDPADIIILADPAVGFLNVSIRTIWEHITARHGTLTSADFAALRVQLTQPIDSTSTANSLFSTHRSVHQQYAAAGQPMSSVDKFHFIRQAVIHRPDIKTAFDNYIILHPTVADQSFDILSTYVEQQQSNATPTAASMGFSAAATGAPISTHPLEQYLTSPAFAALIQQQVKAALPHGRDRNRRPRTAAALPPAAAPTTSTPQRTYCHVHGYDTHRGSACRFMLNNAKFTKEHLAALNHTALPGANADRL